MFEKIDVNGADAHPLFVWLRDRGAGHLRYDGREVELHQVPHRPQGQVRERFAPTTEPADIAPEIEKLL